MVHREFQARKGLVVKEDRVETLGEKDHGGLPATQALMESRESRVLPAKKGLKERKEFQVLEDTRVQKEMPVNRFQSLR